MLTRLKVSGFKNLIELDVSFGPFTCIAGATGVGKSNLLDAIVFLSALADRPLIDAALAVRDQGAKTGDIRGLFHHVGDSFSTEMRFEAEMIIPESGTDDLGQPAQASSTFVQYVCEPPLQRGRNRSCAGIARTCQRRIEAHNLGRSGASSAFCALPGVEKPNRYQSAKDPQVHLD